MADALDFLKESVVDHLITSSKGQEQNIQNLQQAEQISKDKSGLYNDISAAAGVASRAQSAAIMAAEKKTAQAAVAAGLDPAGGADRLTSLIGETTQVSEDLRGKLRDLTQRKNLSFFDDPLQFIANQFVIPFAEDRVVNTANQLDFLQKQIGSVDAQMTQAARTARVTTESMTAAQADALAQIAAGEAAVRARDSQLEALKYNSAAVNAAVEGSKERVGMVYETLNAQMRQNQYVLALEEFDQRRKEFDWRKAERDAADQAKKEAKSIDEVFLGHIQRGYAALGMPVPGAMELKSQVQLLKTGASKELARVYEIGRRSSVLGISSLGSTPAETVDNLETLPNNVAPARLEALALIKQVKEQVLADPKIDKKDQAAVDKEINKLTYQSIGGQLASISPGSGNIFDIGDLGGFLTNPQSAGIPDMNATPLAQKLLIPAISTGVKLDDPAKVLALTSSAIQKGTITSAEAIDGLTFLYRKANLINQAALGLPGMGIVAPNDGANYNARLGAFRGTVDMTNPTQVGQWLARDLADRTFRDSVNWGKPQGRGMSGGKP